MVITQDTRITLSCYTRSMQRVYTTHLFGVGVEIKGGVAIIVVPEITNRSKTLSTTGHRHNLYRI